MTTAELITRRIAEFKHKYYPLEVTAIYVGHVEYISLAAMVNPYEANLMVAMQPTFHGIPLFRVAENSHLHIAGGEIWMGH